MDPVLKTGFDPFVGEAVVMKMRLRPFTLGHYLLLEEIESPFLNNLLQPNRADLLKAIILCSQPQDKARQNLLSPTTWWIGYIMGVLNRGVSLDVESNKFRAYLELNRELPAARCSPGAHPRHAPDTWRLLVMLMKDFHMSMQEARDTTVRQANCLWAVQAELAGAIELMPSDAFNDERLRQFRALADLRNHRRN